MAAPPESTFDLAVIGGGPGGYVAAIRAAQLGFKTACIERDATLGGTCLNIGCIPSKALLDSSELYHQIGHGVAVHGIQVGGLKLDLAAMMRRKTAVVTGLTRGVESLFKKNGVAWLRGSGRLIAPNQIEVADAAGNRRIVDATRMVLATGSAPMSFPDAPFDEERVLSSTGALSLTEVPRHLIVIGGGVIGMELGSVWLRLGAKVTVLELAPTILPGLEGELTRAAESIFRKQGFAIRTSVRVSQLERTASSVRVSLEGGETIDGDRVLVSIGRRSYTDGLGAAELGSVSTAGAQFRWMAVTTPEWGKSTPLGTPSAASCWPTRRRKKGSPRSNRRPAGRGVWTTMRWLLSSTRRRRSPRLG
jgi:dihydrolipoamide dehydrogenase